jgi:YVTN family beta-propeller protein
LLYATQTNSKKVWVIDVSTNNVLKKIKVGVKYRSIAIDEKNNMIYIAGRGGITDDSTFFGVIDGKNNHVEKIVSKFYFANKKVWELYYNEMNKKLYAYMEGRANTAYDSPTVSIQVIDIDSKSFEKKVKKNGLQDGMGFDQSKNRFYFSDVGKGEFSVFNESLEEIGLFRFTESKNFVEQYITGSGLYTKFAINTALQLIYIADAKMNFLHIIKE